MILDKLLRKDAAPNINCGAVLQVDSRQKRVRVQGRNSFEVWASYDPADFADLQEGQTVAVAFSGSSAFVVRRLTDALPTETTIQEV